MSALTPRRITLGFYAAALVNIVGILLFSKGYTNELMSAMYPSVFSTFSLVCIQLWGLAYWATARHYDKVPQIVAVFAVEKFAYVATWIVWMNHFGKQLPDLMSQSFLTGNFYAAYGLIDLSFGVFFAIVAWRGFKTKTA